MFIILYRIIAKVETIALLFTIYKNSYRAKEVRKVTVRGIDTGFSITI